MQTLTSIAALSAIPGPLHLAIGVFDGVHVGHRAVIHRACQGAGSSGGAAVVVTFDPHPVRILRPDQAPRLLTSTAHKRRLIEALGAGYLLILPFDLAFAAMPPAQFIHELAAASHPLREICVGHAWSFGKGRAGNLELLARLGEELGFSEVGVPAIEIDGQIVSSTSIRCAIEGGDLAAAARLLGRDYTILGEVVEGDRIGRQLGFRTANLSAHNEQFPPNGVYAVQAQWRGQTLAGVANIGIRPTIQNASGERVFEVHLFDFDQEIYHQELEVRFHSRLRGEQKFGSLDELRTQIAVDAAQAREALQLV